MVLLVDVGAALELHLEGRVAVEVVGEEVGRSGHPRCPAPRLRSERPRAPTRQLVVALGNALRRGSSPKCTSASVRRGSSGSVQSSVPASRIARWRAHTACSQPIGELRPATPPDRTGVRAGGGGEVAMTWRFVPIDAHDRRSRTRPRRRAGDLRRLRRGSARSWPLRLFATDRRVPAAPAGAQLIAGEARGCPGRRRRR